MGYLDVHSVWVVKAVILGSPLNGFHLLGIQTKEIDLREVSDFLSLKVCQLLPKQLQGLCGNYIN